MINKVKVYSEDEIVYKLNESKNIKDRVFETKISDIKQINNKTNRVVNSKDDLNKSKKYDTNSHDNMSYSEEEDKNMHINSQGEYSYNSDSKSSEVSDSNV